MYEGTLDFPIPLAGLSLVDYNFRKSGAELSMFFAGPILATNLTKPARPRFRFLASEGASYISGQVIAADGGLV